jgi:hypothetical protein
MRKAGELCLFSHLEIGDIFILQNGYCRYVKISDSKCVNLNNVRGKHWNASGAQPPMIWTGEVHFPTVVKYAAKKHATGTI